MVADFKESECRLAYLFTGLICKLENKEFVCAWIMRMKSITEFWFTGIFEMHLILRFWYEEFSAENVFL